VCVTLLMLCALYFQHSAELCFLLPGLLAAVDSVVLAGALDSFESTLALRGGRLEISCADEMSCTLHRGDIGLWPEFDVLRFMRSVKACSLPSG